MRGIGHSEKEVQLETMAAPGDIASIPSKPPSVSLAELGRHFEEFLN
jgi:hypothetical protein